MNALLLRLLTRPVVPALLVFSALSGALFFGAESYLMPRMAGRLHPTVEVPSFQGMKPEEADSLARERGLMLATDTAADFSPDVPAGGILFQFPAAGTQVKAGRRIWVRLSKGARDVEVPALRGLSLRQAEIFLQQLGLRLGETRQIRSLSIPAGAVMGTRPGPKSVLRRGEPVDVDVSGGAEPPDPSP